MATYQNRLAPVCLPRSSTAFHPGKTTASHSWISLMTVRRMAECAARMQPTEGKVTDHDDRTHRVSMRSTSPMNFRIDSRFCSLTLVNWRTKMRNSCIRTLVQFCYEIRTKSNMSRYVWPVHVWCAAISDPETRGAGFSRSGSRLQHREY